MQRTKRSYLNYFISCILIAAITITGISVPESRVKADTTNPIDTGRGYEYSNGKAIGKYLRFEKDNIFVSENNKTNDTNTLKIIADEYNLTINDDFVRSRVYGGEEHEKASESLRYPEGYLWLELDIYVPDSNAYKGYRAEQFYALTNKNFVIMDYGKLIYTGYIFEGVNTGTYLTPYGSNQRFDYWGYDEAGCDITGYRKDGYDAYGYDKDGYNKSGYDKDGYNKEGYNLQGYNRDGYDKDGYNSLGYDKDGYDKDGYNAYGYDREGYDRNGYKDGYDRDGYDSSGYNRNGYNRDGYDKYGYNKDGYDRHGYDKDGRDSEGYDRNGYGRDGYNKEGYDKDGYDKDGRTPNGYDRDGYDKEGYDRDGRDEFGRDREGYDSSGYGRDGYNKDGYDWLGYDKNGNYNSQRDIYKDYYGQDGYNGYGYDKDGYNRLGINKDGYNKKGEKAKSKVDTGEGFEYNITGGGCGIKIKSNLDEDEFGEIVSREYNITYNKNDSKSLNSAYTSVFKSFRYPEGYTYKYLKIDNTYIYCLTNSSGKVYDYGKIDVSDQSDISSVAANLPSTPLGGKKSYDYYGCSRDGYNKNGLDYQGFGRDGYNKKNRNKNGYDKKGYLYTEEKTSSERAVPTDFTTITESYKKKLRSEWEDGYFYDENGVYNYDKIDDFDYLKWYDDGRLAGATERYYDDGETVIDIGEMEFYKWGNGIFNFNLPNKDKIRKSYSGYTDMLSIEKQKVGYIKDKKTELKEENCIKSYTLYITPAKSCRLYTGKYIKEKNVKKFKFLNKGKSYKITGSYKDVIVLANDTGELERKFSYKLVPSTKNVSNLKMSAYKGKMISADKTSIKVKAKSSVNDDIYLANINAEDIKVTSSNKAIVKVSKKNKAGNIYCTLKLTGGSKKGKATVTIKDKNSGKKQKITVTNSK